MKDELYETPDLYLAALIHFTSKQKPTLRDDGAIVFFQYRPTPELAELVEGFNSGTLSVNALGYATSAKIMRTIMMQSVRRR